MPHAPQPEFTDAPDGDSVGRNPFDRSLIYLASPFSHPDPEISQRSGDAVN